MKKLLLVLIFSISTLLAQNLFHEGNKLVAKGKGVMFIFESATCSYCELLRNDFKDNKEMNTLAKEFNIYFINQDSYQEYLMGDQTPP